MASSARIRPPAPHPPKAGDDRAPTTISPRPPSTHLSCASPMVELLLPPPHPEVDAPLDRLLLLMQLHSTARMQCRYFLSPAAAAAPAPRLEQRGHDAAAASAMVSFHDEHGKDAAVDDNDAHVLAQARAEAEVATERHDRRSAGRTVTRRCMPVLPVLTACCIAQGPSPSICSCAPPWLLTVYTIDSGSE
ncbi:hypothetical protein GQ55_6G174500 [Panicum hallii var. hallii]|uniref:Uncharacterized protein n=1 Tax=Panicum hallii var. hallii TaxID=1504633 RepID=A0A2T7D6X7_9POAL|nr:hypothetical protein GQ55_6G174500 [Panicum hallii var. hallii]